MKPSASVLPCPHPGLDPGSRFWTLLSGTLDQVRGHEEEKARFANEVAQFSGLSA